MTKRQKYMKKYYAEHKKEINARGVKYYVEHRDEVLARTAKYAAEHKDEVLAKAAKWQKRNPEKARASTHQWRERNPEKIRAMGLKWREANAERISWTAMLRRCTNINYPYYKYYGALGVKVCRRWFNFDNFLADLGPRPSKEHSLSRLLDSGNYEPGNVVWGDRKHQAEQKRLKRLLKAAELRAA